MSLVITGAAGQLGRRVAELLLETHDPADVVLVTRTTEALDDLAARGARVRHGDFDDPSTLAAAFASGERLLLISTDAVFRRTEQHRAAIDAAVAAGVKHIIYTSVLRPEPGNPFGVTYEHVETEALLEAAPVATTMLRNGFYVETRVGELLGAAASGELRHNQGDGRAAILSREDCARVAAAVLGGTGHEDKAYDVTGDELLTAADRAGIYAELLGRPVTAVEIDDDAAVAAIVAAGVPEAFAKVGASVGIAIREGWLDVRTSVVEELTGTVPERVRDVFARHVPAADRP